MPIKDGSATRRKLLIAGCISVAVLYADAQETYKPVRIKQQTKAKRNKKGKTKKDWQ